MFLLSSGLKTRRGGGDISADVLGRLEKPAGSSAVGASVEVRESLVVVPFSVPAAVKSSTAIPDQLGLDRRLGDVTMG